MNYKYGQRNPAEENTFMSDCLLLQYPLPSAAAVCRLPRSAGESHEEVAASARLCVRVRVRVWCAGLLDGAACARLCVCVGVGVSASDRTHTHTHMVACRKTRYPLLPMIHVCTR